MDKDISKLKRHEKLKIEKMSSNYYYYIFQVSYSNLNLQYHLLLRQLLLRQFFSLAIFLLFLCNIYLILGYYNRLFDKLYIL